jgi:predicted adenylyl cyclase CyaB
MSNIEVEVRSFITSEEHEKLLEFFKREAEFVKEDSQETFYFDCEQDLRIQRNNFFSKIWMKKGKMHDGCREEIEIKFAREDFEKLEQLFISLGFDVQIKWFRKRLEFKWHDVLVCLDDTKGYGLIIELEVMCAESDAEKEREKLAAKLESLGIKITSREEFDRRFLDYKKNWRSLI